MASGVAVTLTFAIGLVALWCRGQAASERWPAERTCVHEHVELGWERAREPFAFHEDASLDVPLLRRLGEIGGRDERAAIVDHYAPFRGATPARWVRLPRTLCWAQPSSSCMTTNVSRFVTRESRGSARGVVQEPL